MHVKRSGDTYFTKPDFNEAVVATYILWFAVATSQVPVGEKARPVGNRIFPTAAITGDFRVPDSCVVLGFNDICNTTASSVQMDLSSRIKS